MKPRSDNRLAKLTDEQRELLVAWLMSGMGYETARVRIKTEWSISTSVAALSAFWQEECAPRLLARRARAAAAATALIDEAAEVNPRLDAALRGQLKQRAFEALLDQAADPQALAGILSQALTLAKIEAGDRDREIKTAQLELDRQRFRRETCELFLQWARDENAKAIADGAGTQADKIEALGQLMFGEGWK